MGLIPQPVIEEVLARADILRTARDYVSMKKSGSSFKGLCPFHDENTPSFFVTPTKGIFKCFGCGVGGNVITFLMEIEGWSFPETVRQLADRTGVDIPEQNPQEAERAQKRRRRKKLYRRIMDRARSYFEQQLWGQQGRAARQYLDERGIDQDTAQSFGLGYAPGGWHNLIDYLGEHDIDPTLAERAGLAMARSNSAGHYDRFRHRVIFPIVDIWDHTLAFGGRTIAANDDAPKYINSPETRFYTKGEQLYGLHAAKQSIQKAGYATLVEGNFDVIGLHANGFDTAVAPMGTALTGEQASLLDRYCDRVVVAFDGDKAGEEASVRCLEAFSSASLQADVIRFDEHEDPDTFIRRHGSGALGRKIENAQSLVSWALDRVLVPAEGGQVGPKLDALQKAGQLLGHVGNEVVWQHHAREISRRLDIEPKLLKDYIRRPDQLRQRARQAVIAAQQPLELDAAEYGLLAVLVDHPEWLSKFLDEQLENLLSTRELSELFGRMQRHYDRHGQLEAPVLLETLDHVAFRRTVAKALADTPYAPDKALQFYQDCIRTLKRNWARRSLDDLTRQIEHVDFYDDRQKFEQLTRQKQKIAQFKASLDWQRSP